MEEVSITGPKPPAKASGSLFVGYGLTNWRVLDFENGFSIHNALQTNFLENVDGPLELNHSSVTKLGNVYFDSISRV